MSKKRARTYAGFKAGDVFVHSVHEDVFVLLESDLDPYWDVVCLHGQRGESTGMRRPHWLLKASRCIAGYVVYRGAKAICTT